LVAKDKPKKAKMERWKSERSYYLRSRVMPAEGRTLGKINLRGQDLLGQKMAELPLIIHPQHLII
jgi:hypothetical protein